MTLDELYVKPGVLAMFLRSHPNVPRWELRVDFEDVGVLQVRGDDIEHAIHEVLSELARVINARDEERRLYNENLERRLSRLRNLHKVSL